MNDVPLATLTRRRLRGHGAGGAPGTLAEYIAVPIKQLYAKPAHLSLVEAAAIPLAGLTAYR